MADTSLSTENHMFVMLHKSHRAFTLIELLVVIAIVAVAAAILIPISRKTKQDAKAVLTMNNQRQIVTLLNTFASDNYGEYPQSVATIGPLTRHWNWQEPTMLTSFRRRSPGLHRSLGAYLRGYIKDATIMFCPNAPTKYKYLQKSWDAGDNWDNPETPPSQDPVIGTYCFYWNYVGFLPEQEDLFRGPQNAPAGRGQSKLLVSDYFGYDHWRSRNSYSSCERFKAAAVIQGTRVSSDYWSGPKAGDKVDIKLHAGYTDGHVERYRPADTVTMKVSMTSDGTVPYPSELGPGTFYLPKNALR